MAWDDPPDFTTGVVVDEQDLDTLGANLLATTHVEVVSAATQDVTNTTAETTLLSYTLPAGRLGTDRCLRLTAFGDYKYAVVGRSLDLRLKFGASTLTLRLQDMTVASAREFQWDVEARIANIGVANVQAAQLVFRSGMEYHSPFGNETGPMTSVGTGAGRSEIRSTGTTSTLWAIDTTAAVLLELTAQWDTASTNEQLRKRYAVLELIGS